MSRYDWMDHAACAGYDPDAWFPDKTGPNQNGEAVSVCQACPVAGPCADFAKSTGVAFGVWGGAVKRSTALGVSHGGRQRGKRVSA